MDAARLAALNPCLVCGGLSAGTCRRRRCRVGIEKWSTDVWSVLAVALQHLPSVLLVVVTAPGADVLPWDRSRCLQVGAHRCSGKIGCRVDERARDRWEADVQRRWCNLRQAIVMRLQRQGYTSPLRAYVDEDQRRGAWHRNLVLLAGPSGWAFVRHLKELAPQYGFGFVDGKVQPTTGLRAASYCAGYLTGKSGTKAESSVQVIAQRSPSKRKVWWVSADLTTETHVTMGTLRRGRRCMAARAGLVDPPTEGLAVLDWLVIDVATGAVLHAVWSRESIQQAAEEVISS